MTKKPSQPDSKSGSSRTGGGKGGENVEGPQAMARFRSMAKKVVSADRKKVADLERRERKSKND